MTIHFKALDFQSIEANAQSIVAAVREEPVAVYAYLREQFVRGPVDSNSVFQFVFRSFYRLDNAGLEPEFGKVYFQLMEQHRNSPEIPLKTILMRLNEILDRRGRKNLQFSFITKLANTINPDYPIYDVYVADVFDFRAPAYTKDADQRADEYLEFYSKMRETYSRIIAQNLLEISRKLFRSTYGSFSNYIPETKVVDFILWTEGKRRATRKKELITEE